MIFFERVFSYEEPELDNVLVKCFEKNNFFQRHDKKNKIFIKLNLLTYSTPEQVITTNPMFFAGVCRVLKKHGYNNIFAGDSPGIGEPYEVALKSGIIDVCDKYEIQFNPIDKSKKYSVKESISEKSLFLWDKIDYFDVIINLPKIKTHSLMLLTLSVKNFYGILPGKTNKVNGHFKSRTHDEFASRLIDIYKTVDGTTPVFSIVDGIWAMEGDGPRSGTKVIANAVFASYNAFLLDFVIAKWLKIELNKFPLYVTYSNKVENIDKEIEYWSNIIGKYENNFKVPDIQDVSFEKVPEFLKKLYNYLCYTYPYIEEKKCIKCMNCYKSCPPKAININKNYPKIDYKRCIRCFCCHEMCVADSIVIKKSLFLKIIDNIVLFIQKVLKI